MLVGEDGDRRRFMTELTWLLVGEDGVGRRFMMGVDVGAGQT